MVVKSIPAQPAGLLVKLGAHLHARLEQQRAELWALLTWLPWVLWLAINYPDARAFRILRSAFCIAHPFKGPEIQERRRAFLVKMQSMDGAELDLVIAGCNRLIAERQPRPVGRLTQRFREQRTEVRELYAWVRYAFTYPVPSWVRRRPLAVTWSILRGTAPWHGTQVNRNAFRKLMAHIATGTPEQLDAAERWMIERKWDTPVVQCPMRPAVRVLLWVYVRPVEFGRWLSNKYTDVWRCADTIALGLCKFAVNIAVWCRGRFHRSLGQNWPAGSETTSRAFDLLYPDEAMKIFEDWQPYSPMADGPLVRRAALVVSGMVGALTVGVGCLLLLLFVPLDLQPDATVTGLIAWAAANLGSATGH